MNMNSKDKVVILLQEEKTATDQMSEIKRDEMSWLKVFLLFYGALIAWIVARWFDRSAHSTASPNVGADDVILLWTAAVFSLVATLMFAALLVHRRHSYFLVRKRLHTIQKLLKLYEPAEWDNLTILSPEHRSTDVCDCRSWLELTKPLSSFLTRLVYIIGANLVIDFLVWLAFRRTGSPQGPCFILLFLVLNVFLGICVYVHDLYHFLARVGEK